MTNCSSYCFDLLIYLWNSEQCIEFSVDFYLLRTKCEELSFDVVDNHSLSQSSIVLHRCTFDAWQMFVIGRLYRVSPVLTNTNLVSWSSRGWSFTILSVFRSDGARFSSRISTKSSIFGCSFSTVHFCSTCNVKIFIQIVIWPAFPKILRHLLNSLPSG